MKWLCSPLCFCRYLVKCLRSPLCLCRYLVKCLCFPLCLCRYLVKCLRMLASGESVPEVMKFLQTHTASQTSRLDTHLNMPDLIEAFGHRAAR